MDLYALQPHMKNRSVMVNGTIYRADGDGKIANVSEADAAKLLSTKGWATTRAVPGAESRAIRREAYKAQAQLITRAGQVVERPPQPVLPAAEALPATPANKSPADLAPSADEPPTMRSESKSDAPSGPMVDEAQESGDEWPDPSMAMSKAELQRMAHAYGVETTPATTKAQLVEAIKAAMFG